MSKDNITPIRTDAPRQTTTKPITLEMVIASMEDWRLTKKKLNEKIPEKIWDQVFALITTPEPLVLKVLGISQGQFISKKLERKASVISPLNVSETSGASFMNEANANNLLPNNSETAMSLIITVISMGLIVLRFMSTD